MLAPNAHVLPPPSLSGAQHVGRVVRLAAHVSTTAAQVPLPPDSVDVPATLSPEEVQHVFAYLVPGVQSFLYRGQPGVYIMNFLGSCYQEGLQAFRDTTIGDHLMRLYRLIVHYGRDRRSQASLYLAQIAEAFMDCQAVQARAIEKVGLEIVGVNDDFRGLLVRLLGGYKIMAVKVLAVERVRMLGLQEDNAPTHYENRLIADLGPRLGLNRDDIRRAELDQHAAARFPKLKESEQEQAAARAKELLDLGAAVQAIVAEINSFSANTPACSLSRQFLEWVGKHLEHTKKHIVFDMETCTKLHVEDPLVLAILEDIFLGEPKAPAEEIYHEQRLMDLFQQKQAV